MVLESRIALNLGLLGSRALEVGMNGGRNAFSVRESLEQHIPHGAVLCRAADYLNPLVKYNPRSEWWKARQGRGGQGRGPLWPAHTVALLEKGQSTRV